MSKKSKIILWVVIIIAVLLIAWCYFGTNAANAPVSAPVGEGQSSQNQQVAVSNVPVSGLTTSPSDDSNAALNADVSAVGAQSAAMDQDTAAASQ